MRLVEVEVRGARYRVAFPDDGAKAMAVTRLLPHRMRQGGGRSLAVTLSQARGAIGAAVKELRQ